MSEKENPENQAETPKVLDSTETTKPTTVETAAETVAPEATTTAPVTETIALDIPTETVVASASTTGEKLVAQKVTTSTKTGDVTTAVFDEEEDTKPKRPKLEAEVRTPHDDFDWSIGNDHKLNYTDSQIDNYLAEYETAISSISDSEIVTGTVTSIAAGDVVLDINYKSDGLVSLSEFRDMPDMKIGDEVKVYVEAREDDRGQLVLSRKKAKLLGAWQMLVDSYKNGTIIKGTVVSKTKGGLIADCSGLETFLPGSQIDIKPIIDYDAYVGKTMELKVVKINETIKNAVVSHKALIESDLAEQREIIISKLEKGQVLEGIVKNITDFGAFMDLGGVDGLLYITDISWGRINHPTEIIELNQKLNVVVLDFDENKKRISLGLKQLQPHPWDILDKEIGEGKIIKGKIVNIEDYGAFLEITPGVEGLIHVSEVTWSNHPVHAREFFTLGTEFDAKVVTIDREDRKMSLSIKQLSEDPWSQVIEKYPVGTKHSGEVKNLTPYGVFVELEEGIGGMIHISDLSWTKRYAHPSEFSKVGETIDIQILEIDQDSRKLSLGHKQLEENPWDTFENVFPVGSFHEATIIRKEDRGAIVSLPYGLEAYAPNKHIRKEDGQMANVDEVLTFKVIEFNRDDKRILVSHSRYIDDIKREAEGTVRSEKAQERRETQTAVRSQQSRIEKTTIGDLAGFSNLKLQVQDTPEPPKVEEKKEETPAPPAEAPAAEEKAAVETPKAEEAKEEVAVVADTPVVEEKAAEEPAAEKVEEAPSAPVADDSGKPDDLKKIEGIGPKISEKLSEAGVDTFQKLADADVQKLKDILEAAGSRYRMHDPTTWPEQAGIAAAGDWDKLKELQDRLDGGKA